VPTSSEDARTEAPITGADRPSDVKAARPGAAALLVSGSGSLLGEYLGMVTVPQEQLSCGRAHLRRWRRSDLEALVSASRASWRHLQPWMPWAQDEPDEQSTLPYLDGAEKQ